MTMTMENDEKRVRVVFENDGNILNNSQRSEGLSQSWILLKPQQLHTISDLSSYLLHTFHLHQSCSNGLLLSMDGFVLPPFESTCILKDKDIISIKKKGKTLSDVIDEGGTENPVKELEIATYTQSGVPLLANKEFEKGGQSDTEVDEDENTAVKYSSDSKAVSKKRKQSSKLLISKKKKRRLVVADGVENDVHTENIENHQNDGFVRRKSLCKDTTSKIAQGSTANGKTVLGVKRTDQLQESDEGIKDVTHVPDGTKKVPSRSARRKYAKRKWLKELKKAEKKDDDSCHPNGLLNWKRERAKTKKKEIVNHRPKGLLHWKKLPDIDQQKDNTEEDEQPYQNSDVVDDVVAVVVKPGHIRFEPPGIVDVEHAVIQTPVPVEKLQWSGSTSTNKKKSRKNRKEKKSSPNKKELKKIYAEALATEKELHIDFPIDFENLPPLTTVAEEGDVIAYRLIELSSTWTPELSSFRVGKILWCDPQSTKIVMKPISEKEEENGNTEIQNQPDGLLHDLDGKLEIDFKVLIDVRVVKHGDSVPAKPNAENGEVNPWERLMNREVDPWERLSEASSYTNKARIYSNRIRK